MEEFSQFMPVVTETGILATLAIIFIWDKVKNAKVVENLLNEIKNISNLQKVTLDNIAKEIENTRNSINNTTLSLNLLQLNATNLHESLERHDKRSEHMNTDVKKILERVREFEETK